LYYSEGLAAVFNNNSNDIANNAPYHQRNTPRSVTNIEFPVDAVMIKANFVTPDQAAKAGLKEDQANPVLKAWFKSDKGNLQEYWLIAFHISSKDTPNWVWSTFEYVSNIGRCDFIGCNDAYGYASQPNQEGRNLATNYTPPHVTTDGFKSAPSAIFALNGVYPAEKITDGLKNVFDQLDIGTGPNETVPSGLPATSSWFPSQKDKAWRSYRLKGSQVNFTDSAGRTTLLGNSVTEAGFVTSSSCVTCHARANVNKSGGPALGVFEPKTGYQGYLLSSHGTPNAGWFNQTATKPLPLAVQTDFVWGFLNACPATTGGCKP